MFGPEDPHTLAARHEFARMTGNARDPAGTRDLLAELLPVVERVLGPEHPNTLTTRGNLAYWTGRAGDPAGGPGLCSPSCCPCASVSLARNIHSP